MTRKELFEYTLKGPWKTAGNKTQYKIIELQDSVILAFQGSVQDVDWKYNFDFIVKPYKKQPHWWLTHRGFAKAWKLAENQITSEVLNILDGRELVIVGYSHGAVIASFAYEYFIFHGYNVQGHVFGSARFCWLPSRYIRARFNDLNVYLTYGDIVGHLPFVILGYRHIGEVTKVGKIRMISHLPHLPASYTEAL